jgi:hypothetical protein
VIVASFIVLEDVDTNIGSSTLRDINAIATIAAAGVVFGGSGGVVRVGDAVSFVVVAGVLLEDGLRLITKMPWWPLPRQVLFLADPAALSK